ncbi:cytochrome P450 [Martensiomyces pterosporus]|nr:cytochrome P450 [Martensiomyces pterosporus]
MAGAISKLIEGIDWADLYAQAVLLAGNASSNVLDRIDSVGRITALSSVIAAYAAWRVGYALFLSPLRNIPGPFLARLTHMRWQLIAFTGGAAKAADEDYNRYGDIYVLAPNAVSISNPSDCRTVFGSHAFVKTDFYKSVDILGVHNIFSTRDPQFNQMRRRQIGPSYTLGYLSRMEPKIVKYGIEALKTKWDQVIDEASKSGRKAVVNVNQDLLYATFDITGALAFGREFNALKNNDPKVIEWVASTVHYFGIITNIPLLLWFPFSLILGNMKANLMSLTSFGNESVVVRKKHLAEGGEKIEDLLGAFIEAEDSETKNRMSNEHLLAEIVITLLAGSETSSNTIMWTIHLLTLYPECLKRATQEVRSKFAKGHTIAYTEGRAQLQYLEACLYESMRLKPVTEGQWPRVVPKGGITLSGHFLPAGTEVNINTGGVTRNKGSWKDPYLFNPQRFIDDEDLKRSVFAFSTGVRICPGRNLAWIEMITILANLLKDYDISLPQDAAFGPHILNEHGQPRLMDSKYFIVSTPANASRDCRLVISKAQ